jgi:hypothetical protein
MNKFLLTFMKISISGSGIILASFSLLASSASISFMPQKGVKKKKKKRSDLNHLYHRNNLQLILNSHTHIYI